MKNKRGQSLVTKKLIVMVLVVFVIVVVIWGLFKLGVIEWVMNLPSFNQSGTGVPDSGVPTTLPIYTTVRISQDKGIHDIEDNFYFRWDSDLKDVMIGIDINFGKVERWYKDPILNSAFNTGTDIHTEMKNAVILISQASSEDDMLRMIAEEGSKLSNAYISFRRMQGDNLGSDLCSSTSYTYSGLKANLELVKKGGTCTGDISDWQNILIQYNANKCEVDKSTCKVKSLGCACFNNEKYNKKEWYDVCTQDKPYCYDMSIGCSAGGPDAAQYLSLCRSSLGSDFQPASVCSAGDIDAVDCSVTVDYCACPLSGNLDASGNIAPSVIIGNIPVCSKGQYCYYGGRGCTNQEPSSADILQACRDSLQRLGTTLQEPLDCWPTAYPNEPSEYSIDNCRVPQESGNDVICNCLDENMNKEVCATGQWCYYKKSGCRPSYQKDECFASKALFDADQRGVPSMVPVS